MENENKNVVTLHNDEARFAIRTMFLNDKSIKEIQDEMHVASGTWEACYYRNTQGFRDFVLAIKKEKMLQDAERVSKNILAIPMTDNAKMLAIQQKEAEFLRETQGKDLGYSKRIETIGLNINKTEPLDDAQRAKLNKLLKKTAHNIEFDNDTEVVSHTEPVEP